MIVVCVNSRRNTSCHKQARINTLAIFMAAGKRKDNVTLFKNFCCFINNNYSVFSIARKEYSHFTRPLKYTSEWLSLSDSSFLCTVCTQRFTNAEDFSKHVKTHYKNYTCQVSKPMFLMFVFCCRPYSFQSYLID